VLGEYSVWYLALDSHSDGSLPEVNWLQPRWTVDFEDEEAVLFVRVDATRENRSRARAPEGARIVPWYRTTLRSRYH